MYNEIAVCIEQLGKRYKLYKNPKDKIRDAFGLNFYKKDYYKEFWALRDINITVRKGERVGLIGHNGAGKSTLLKIVTGNIQPTEGRLQVNGKIQALLEMGTGFHPEFTGRENIRASLGYQGLGKKEIAEIEEEIIEFTELGEYIEQPVRTYSAGMYSRLAFATASSVCPELLIIDEVLGAGDAYFNGKCVERMRKLTSEKETTVLFVSHDLQSVQTLCDRVIWIDRGGIRYDGEVLQGIKLYTQSVRKNEELRLKIRDMKISRKQALVLESKQDLYNEYIFRLICENQKQALLCKVYKISVLMDDKELTYIDVGGAMDNNLEENCYIIDVIGNTCWGKAKKNKSGYYREFNNTLGKDGHAPFQIMVSKEYTGKDFELEFLMDILTDDEIQLQLFDQDKNQYETCARFTKQDKKYKVRIAAKKEQKEDSDILIDNIETSEARFVSVLLRGWKGEVGQVFSFRERVKQCEVKIQFKKVRCHFVFVLAVYSMRGDLIFSTCQDVETKQLLEEAEIHYRFPDMKLGPGEYTVSVAVYDTLDTTDNNKEQKFLALLDRGVSFKIENALDYALNIGYFTPDNSVQVVGVKEEDIKCSLII